MAHHQTRRSRSTGDALHTAAAILTLVVVVFLLAFPSRHDVGPTARRGVGTTELKTAVVVDQSRTRDSAEAPATETTTAATPSPPPALTEAPLPAPTPLPTEEGEFNNVVIEPLPLEWRDPEQVFASAASQREAAPVLLFFPETAKSIQSAFIDEYLPSRVFADVQIVLHNHEADAVSSLVEAQLGRSVPRHRWLLFVESNRTSCETLRRIAAVVKPTVGFLWNHDDGADQPCHVGALKKSVRLIFRQLAGNAVDRLSVGHGVFPLPPMWVPGAFHSVNYSKSDFAIASKRKFVWSFVGGSKPLRKKTIDALSRVKPNRFTFANTSVVSPQSMIQDYYSKAKFVPVECGVEFVDCLRVFDASKAGAIPIVVGTESHIVERFGHFFDVVEPLSMRTYRSPPWLTADNWEDALRQVLQLLETPAEIDALQKVAIEFYEQIVRNVVFAIVNNVRRAAT